MEQWIALIGFSFVSSVTPGPNNILLWTSGAAFGVRRTLPHVAGTALGIGAMALAAAAGISAVIVAVPWLGAAMKLGGSLYLLYLAYQVTRMGVLKRADTDTARPLGLVAAAGFQVLNPKAWIFALGAVTTFRISWLPATVGGPAVALTMMLIIVPTALLWAGAGGLLERWVASSRARRVMSLVLAGLLVATIALVWI